MHLVQGLWDVSCRGCEWREGGCVGLTMVHSTSCKSPKNSAKDSESPTFGANNVCPEVELRLP